MSIRLQGSFGFNVFSVLNQGLKSTQQKTDRQNERDNKIAYFENQKENLKNMTGTSLEDISRKLELLHSYEDQIMAAKAEYNNEQMRHVMDEAEELAEKIAEEAKKNEPKTPEERREEELEEALGIEIEDKDGLLEEILEEIPDLTEEALEEMSEESLESGAELLEENVESLDGLSAVEKLEAALEQEQLSRQEIKYKRIDMLV